MPKSQDPDHGVEECTPLLAKSSSRVDEESAPMGYLGAEPTAPPPATAPPPPPPSSTPYDITSKQNDNGKDNDGSNSSDHNQNSPASHMSARNEDDNESKSQLSLTQSAKSGKSGKSRKKKKKVADAASAKSSKSSKPKKKRKEGPQKSVCHLLFDVVRYLAIVASCMMFTMQMVPLVILGDTSTWLQIAVRSYLAIFCLSFILTESSIAFLQRIAPPQNNWILRGFLYSFIGLIGMEQDLAVKVEEIAAGTSSVLGPDYGTLFATLFMSITTWVMIGVGVLYTILGLLCFQGWYERLEKGHREKVKDWKQKKKSEEDFRKQTDKREGGIV